MTTRKFTKGVIAETRSRLKTKVPYFGRLRPGDEWLQVVPVRKTRQPVRFVCAEVDDDDNVIAVEIVTLANGAVRTLLPEAIEMPSQRALNAQRKRREAERREAEELEKRQQAKRAER